MRYILVGLLLLINHIGFSQNALIKANKLEALNNAVNVVNENAHGMLVVHRMLENYNQDINKYVDLESYKINYYTNKDLPKNIFDDPEKWFYEVSPLALIDLSIKQATTTKYVGYQQAIEVMNKMKSKINSINDIRFQLDELIIDKDLTDTSQLNRVYDKLEEGVDLYESYYTLHNELLSVLEVAFKPLIPNANELQYPTLYQKLANLYLSTRRILIAIRLKEDESLEQLIAKHKLAADDFKNFDLESLNSTRLNSRKVQRIKENVINLSNKFHDGITKFYETAEVPEEYRQYGKFYYYYNSELINKFNRYGNGLVFELNQLVNYLDLPVLQFSELPHYYKVIYPKKLEKVEHLAASDSKITALPKMLKERKIEKSNRVIKVDSVKINVALYDHMIEDGDIISLNFNGDWIVEKMKLTAKKKHLKLQLNEEGKNYFILHAENIGRRPPNTMAVEYFYRGQRKQIILKSDLNKSEMIEIEYVKPN